MDGLATQGYPAMGYSLRYEYGLFRQKLVDGWQTELPDTWLPGGGIWLQQAPESSVEVRFGGHIEEQWHNQYHSVRHKDYTSITAIPYDMCIAGMDGKGISLLRVWKAENDKFDMKLFNGGNYMRAMEQQAMSEVITKVLYPEDNHTDGKLLRLSQQYFLVSASIQDIIRRHLYAHGNLDKLPELAAIHLNDTHPVLAIPEMMRVMLDECGYGWDAAWDIVKRTVAYTNHTVMSEALETWNRDLFKHAPAPHLPDCRGNRPPLLERDARQRRGRVQNRPHGAPQRRLCENGQPGRDRLPQRQRRLRPAQRNPQGNRVPRLLRGGCPISLPTSPTASPTVAG